MIFVDPDGFCLSIRLIFVKKNSSVVILLINPFDFCKEKLVPWFSGRNHSRFSVITVTEIGFLQLVCIVCEIEELRFDSDILVHFLLPLDILYGCMFVSRVNETLGTNVFRPSPRAFLKSTI